MLVKKIFKLKNLRYLLLVFLSACIENAPLDSLSPEGPYARSIDELFWITFWIAVVIFVIVQGALLLSVFVYKEKPDSPEPKQIHGNTKLEILWTVIPVLILAAIAVPTVRTIFDLAREPENALKIEVIGHAHPKDKPNAAIVRVRITSGEDSYDLNYQMIKKKNRWGVINIIFSGVNIVSIFKTQFSSLASEYQDDLDKVIDGWEISDIRQNS